MTTTQGEQATREPLFCLGCGYDLQGLDPTGDCPECGKPICESANLPPLWLTHPKWFKRQLIALWMLVAAQLLACWHILLPLLLSLLPATLGPTNAPVSGSIVVRVNLGFPLIVGLVVGVSWLMSKPNKQYSAESPENRWRRLIFPLACAYLLFNLFTLLRVVSDILSAIGFDSFLDLYSLLSLMSAMYVDSVIGIVVMVGVCIWFPVMLHRINADTPDGPASINKPMRTILTITLILSLVVVKTVTLSLALCTTLVMLWFATYLHDAKLIKYIRALFAYHVFSCLLFSLDAVHLLLMPESDIGIPLRYMSVTTFLATLFVVFNIHRRARELQAESVAQAA